MAEVATSKLLRAEALGLSRHAGRRVRFTAMDASPQHLAVGANSGSLYFFDCHNQHSLLRMLPFSSYADESVKNNPEPIVALRFRFELDLDLFNPLLSFVAN
jgi:hypothetical protein